MNTERKLLTKRDFIILAAIVLFALLLVFALNYHTESAVNAVITVGGKEVKEINLKTAENETLTLENGIEILVKDGRIGFVKSDCPDKICIKSGMLSHAGEAAACLPHKTVISLEGEGSPIDVLTY
jgi:hypothetical protein